MNRIFLVAGFLVVAANSSALADSPDNVPGLAGTTPGISPEGALAPISIVEGPGVKVGEGTVLHPIVGMETGFISNVFYEARGENPVGSGVLRLIAQAGAGSLSPQRLAIDSEGLAPPNHGIFQYRADLRLTYDLMLSTNDEVQDQGGLGVGALFRGTVYPDRPWSFLYLENFQRVIRATNFESTSRTNRDINRLQLGLQFAPGGRALTGLLHYENVIDVFEDRNQRFANRMHNLFGITGSWRFRPVTVFFADATFGMFTGIGDSVKVDSFPLTVSVGAQTLLTLNTTLIARLGYTNGFYSQGPSYSAPMGGLELGYRYSPMGRATFMYDYVHQDSINANFFRDHHFRILLEQQFVPFVVTVQPELRLRKYDGVTEIVPTAPTNTREDTIIAVAAGARYNLRDWFATVIEYRLAADLTDFMYAIDGDVDRTNYTRHEIVVGVRAAL